MKSDIKRGLTFSACLFGLYLAIRYWGVVETGLTLFLSAMSPIILGFVIAYVLNILTNFFEAKLPDKIGRMKRALSIVLGFIAIVLMFALLVNMIIPELVRCLQLLGQKLPAVAQKFLAFIEEQIPIESDFIDNISAQIAGFDWQTAIENIMQGLEGAVGTAFSFLGGFVSFMITFVVALVFSVYVLLEKDKIGRTASDILNLYFKERIAKRIRHIAKTFNECFRRFIVGQCLEAVILGVLCIVGMLILRIPYATMIGTLIGFTALIPVAGAYIGAGVGAIMISSVSYTQAIAFIIFIIVLQQIEGNLIYPKVVGSSIGLPSILVLIAITVGGGVLGIGGMLIAVPIVAALYQLIGEDIERRKQEKGIAE